jgi:membrane protein DedA with SNARE-associated domain
LKNVYVKIGFLSIFLYELVPSVFRILTTTGFYIGLLNEGINPMVLIILTSVGRIFGFYLLYLLGRFLYRIFKKKNRELADADHILHKYKLIVFFLVPFFGALGDIVMVVAGHQRIGFLKIVPLLFLSNILRNAIWLYPTIAQIKLASP